MTEEDKQKALKFMVAELSANQRSEVWLEMADLQVSADYFGNSYPLALCYMASHIGTLETRGGGDEVGSVSSKSEGSISISYSASGSGTDDDLTQTTYGRMFLKLRDNCRPGPALTGSFGFGRF